MRQSSLLLSLLIALFLVTTGLLSPASAAPELQVVITLTTDPARPGNSGPFSVYEPVYALITLNGLSPGRHLATVNWIGPENTLEQSTPHRFTLGNQSGYIFYSWLKLMKNGPFKRTLGGQTFDDRYLGQWKVQVVVDGRPLAAENFTLR